MYFYSIEKSEIQKKKKRSANKYGSHFEHFWVCLQVFVLWGLAGMYLLIMMPHLHNLRKGRMQAFSTSLILHT